jgi:hypothetical protein
MCPLIKKVFSYVNSKNRQSRYIKYILNTWNISISHITSILDYLLFEDVLDYSSIIDNIISNLKEVKNDDYVTFISYFEVISYIKKHINIKLNHISSEISTYTENESESKINIHQLEKNYEYLNEYNNKIQYDILNRLLSLLSYFTINEVEYIDFSFKYFLDVCLNSLFSNSLNVKLIDNYYMELPSEGKSDLLEHFMYDLKASSY